MTALAHLEDARPTRTWVVPGLIVAASGLVVIVTGAHLLAVLAMGGLLAAVLVAARPGTAAVLAVGLTFSNATVIATHHHGAPGALALLVPLLLVVTLADQVLRQRLPILVPRSALWMVVFMVVQTVGALASLSPESSVTTVQTFLAEGAVLFLLLTNAIRGWRIVRQAAIVIVATAALLGSLALVQELTGSNSQDFGGLATMSNAVINKDEGGGSARHAGPIGEQNRWAQSLAIVLPLAIALGATDRSRGVRLLARASAVGIVAGMVLDVLAGAVVGLILAGLIVVALRWVRVSTAFLVGAAAVFAVLTLAPTFTDRASTVVTARSSVSSSASATEERDGSFVNRTTEGKAAISVFLAHPVYGVGVGLFPTYFQDQARAQGADRIVGVDREAHSLYLGLAAETGLLGLITFGAFCGSILISLGRVRRRLGDAHPDAAALATGFALAVITYLTTGLFLHFAYIRYFWLIAGLAAAMGMVTDLSPTPKTPRAFTNPT